MPSVAFRRIQIKKETTRGTGVAADEMLLGALTMQAVQENYMPEDEERNSLALLHRRVPINQSSSLRFEGSAKFQQIHHFLNMCMRREPTTSDAGSSNPGTSTAIREYAPSLVAANNHETYTFEYGDDAQGYEVNYVLANQLQFTLDANSEFRMNADLFGYFPKKATMTSGLYPPTVEDMISLKTQIFIDNTWAGLGTTERANVLAAANITIPSGLTMTQYADGDLDFSDIVESKRAIEFDVTLKHSATDGATKGGIAEYDAYVSQDTQFMRYQISGSQIESGHNHEFIIDMAMKYTEPPEFFGDRDGENVITLRGRSFEDPTSKRDYRAIIKTSRSVF